MIIYPAIDIKDGKCVRLTQGDFNQVKVYDQDPVEVARKWQSAGATHLHVVDLDGALKGTSINNNVIQKIVKEVNMKVQVGGGLRTLEDIKAKLALGVDRVIIGTAAIKNPELVKEAVELFGDQIVVGIDAKDGMVAVEGWGEVSTVSAIELAQKMKSLGVKDIVLTDIAKDGMLMGPNFELMQKMMEATNLRVVASGGIHNLDDILQLKEMGLYATIIGKALYENNVDLKEVMERC